MAQSDARKSASAIAQMAVYRTEGSRVAYLVDECGGSLQLHREARSCYAGIVADLALRSSARPPVQLVRSYAEGDAEIERLAFDAIVASVVEDIRHLDETDQESRLNEQLPDCPDLVRQVKSELRAANDDAPSPGWPPPHPGDVLEGRYRLEAPSEEGGQGVVWSAYDDEDGGKRVAVKFMRPDRSTRDWQERFKRECAFLKDIKHPAVVCHLHDGIALRNGGPFLVTEWIDGQPLDKHVDERTLGPTECVRLVRDAARGVQAIHDRGFFHRDIKPKNILVDKCGCPSVVDLGIGRSIVDADGTRLTSTGQHIGSPPYMSPEQQRGLPIGPQADVYSLGTTLFVVLTGKLTSLDDKALHRALKDQPDSKRLVRILRCACDEDPLQRYRTVGDLTDELTSWLADHQPSKFRATATRRRYPEEAHRAAQIRLDARHRRWQARRRAIIKWTSAVLAVLILTLAGIATTGWIRASHHQRQAEQAVSLLLSAIEAMDPYERMTAAGGPHARAEMKSLQQLLKSYESLKPLDQKMIRFAIATTAYAVGDYETSRDAFQELLKILGTETASSFDEVALACLGLGQTMRMLGGDMTDAEKSLGRAITIWDQFHPALSIKRPACREALGELFVNAGQHAKGADQYQRAQAEYEAIDSQAPLPASLLLKQARLALLEGDPDAAALYERAYERAKSDLLGSDLAFLKIRYERAMWLEQERRYQEAESEVRVVFDGFTRTFGEDDVQTIMLTAYHSRLLRLLERIDEATAVCDRAVAAAMRKKPPDKKLEAYVKKFRAGLHMTVGMRAKDQDSTAATREFDKAASLYHEIAIIMELLHDDTSSEYGEILSNHAAALNAGGKHDRAEPYARKALKVHRAAADSDFAPGIRSATRMLARAIYLGDAGRAAEAHTYLAPLAVAAREHVDWPDLEKIVEDFQELLRLLEKPEEAAEWGEWLRAIPKPVPSR